MYPISMEGASCLLSIKNVGEPSSLSQYPPISLLGAISKLFESITKKFVEHLSSINIMSYNQYRFNLENLISG